MSKHVKHVFAGSLAIIGLLATAVIPLTAFEAHVINVTARIDPAPCEELKIESMNYWKKHSELWILPQTIGSETIDTPAKAAVVFKDYIKSTRHRVRAELLALKFNIAYFHVGVGLAFHEDITVNELAAEADALLTKVPAAKLTELQKMYFRLSTTNEAGRCLVCVP